MHACDGGATCSPQCIFGADTCFFGAALQPPLGLRRSVVLSGMSSAEIIGVVSHYHEAGKSNACLLLLAAAPGAAAAAAAVHARAHAHAHAYAHTAEYCRLQLPTISFQVFSGYC
jgi:hypothetical protein